MITGISAEIEIKELLNDWDIEKALEIVEEFLPNQHRLLSRKAKTTRGERQIKARLKSLLGNRHKLIRESDKLVHVVEPKRIKEKAKEDVERLELRTVRHHQNAPELLQKLIVDRKVYINKRQKLSNTLHELKNKPEKLKEVSDEILELRRKIDEIDSAEKHYEREGKLPNKYEPKEIPTDLDELKKKDASVRSAVTRLKKQVKKREDDDKDGKLAYYKDQLASKEAELESIRQATKDAKERQKRS